MKRSKESKDCSLPPKKVFEEPSNQPRAKLCLICNQPENAKKKKYLSKISKDSKIKEKLINAARIRNDDNLLRILQPETDLFILDSRYHLFCYQDYTREKTLQSIINRNSEQPVKYSFDDIIKEVFENYGDILNNNGLVLLPDICAAVKNIIRERDLPFSEESIRSSYIKSRLDKITDNTLQFFSYNGKPDIIASGNTSITLLLHELIAFRCADSEKNDVPEVKTKCLYKDRVSEKVILHEAAGIIRSSIQKIDSSPDVYYDPHDVSFDSSRKFVPLPLQTFIFWLIDEYSFKTVKFPNEYEIDETNKQLSRAITLSECIIFSSNETKEITVPPFQHGLALQMHHKFASKMLIDTLYSYGFSISYDSLRTFLTSAANYELNKCDTAYIPTGLILANEGGKLIQEGDDNLDINTQTVDGKNTFHVMARVLFQIQTKNNNEAALCIPKLKNRSLSLKSSASVLREFLPRSEIPSPEKLSRAVKTMEAKLNTYGENSFNQKDITWGILRLICRGSFGIQLLTESKNQVIPSWVAFNVRFAKREIDSTTPFYLPCITAKPSDPSTIYTTLKEGLERASNYNQNFSIHTFDQQLYAIAQNVKLSCHNELSSSIIRLGGFHYLCTYISCINKIWGDCGLQDMLIESGVYARNTAEHMLEGKQFHRAVRALTLCFDTMFSLMFENFLDWLHLHKPECSMSSKKYEEFIQKYRQKSCSPDDFSKLCQKTKENFLPMFDEFRKIRREESVNFQFWDDFLLSIQLILDYIRAERECNWDLHLQTAAAMIPYFFACSKQNYSRWGTLYVLEMSLSLPNEVRKLFDNGEFAIRFTSGAFRGLWSDIGVEMSAIRVAKSSSGIIGLTRRDSAITRWSLTRNLLGQYAEVMSRRSGQFDENTLYREHEGDKPAMRTRDEAHVRKITEHVQNHMSDPYSVDTRSDILINIGSGSVATPEISKSLLEILKIGRERMFEFIETTLEKTSLQQKNFFDPIKKVQLKTFSDMRKTISMTVGNKIMKQSISAETVYQRALAVCATRSEVNLQKILSLPITNIPPALFKPDGSRRTGNKCDLMACLENEISGEIIHDSPNFLQSPIIIIDGMALLQSFNPIAFNNFNEIAEKVLSILLSKLRCAREVHLIFDRYDDLSPNPKQEERMRRYGIGGNIIDIRGERPVKDLKKVLSNNENKSSLTTFICTYIKDNFDASIARRTILNKVIYVAGGLLPRKESFKITENTCRQNPNFSCNHIDADTRLLFEAKTIDVNNSSEVDIVIESPDTDVFILLLAHSKDFHPDRKLWFYTGRIIKMIDRRRYIPIHTLANKIGPVMSSATLSIHALTGCDTTSSIFGIGKKKAYAAAKKMTEEDLERLANVRDLELVDGLEIMSIFLSTIYDPSKKTKGDRKDINSLRYQLAASKNLPIEKLPPCKSELQQHLLRSIWQINEWQESLSAEKKSLDPLQFGWLQENGQIIPNFFDGESALEHLQKYFCSCSRRNSCDGETCPCKQSGLACCEICTCEDSCKNKEKENAEENEESDIEIDMENDVGIECSEYEI